MKCLSAGLTFVNFATFCGLIFGIVGGGLGEPAASASLLCAAAAAILAFLRTVDPEANRPRSDPEAPKLSKRAQRRLQRAGEPIPSSPVQGKYPQLWKWVMAAFFAIFAFRSFCWLLFIADNELRIQSPNNLGDLALHITHIRYFANGVPLWPANPIYTFGQHLRYPAGIDLFNALFSCLHVDLIRSLVWVGLLTSLATFYAFYRWGGAFTVAGFLFNGGLIGFQFFHHFHFADYQDVNSIAWKSIPLTMFVTQRGFLYAIPTGLLLLWHWREKYLRNAAQDGPLPLWVELSLYASMPLFHLHTFIALSIVLVCLFIAGDAQIRGHILTLLVSAFIPATFLIWLITDHFHAKSVLELQWGWVQNEPGSELRMPFFRFWFFNFGILMPLVLTLVGLLAWRGSQEGKSRKFEVIAMIALGLVALAIWGMWKIGFTPRTATGHWLELSFLALIVGLGLVLVAWAVYRIRKGGYAWNEKLPEEIAFVFAAIAIFVFFFSVKTAPWGWDNLKLGIWAYFIVLPILWTHLIVQWNPPMRAAVCFALFFSGFISLIGGLAAGRPGFGFANRAELDAVATAIRKIPIEARFAAFPTYNHPLLLEGRKVALGYPGHLWTQGFDDYGKANELLTRLMQGEGDWRDTARALHVGYIFWGREETTNYSTSKRPWEQSAPVVASGTWGKIYALGSDQ